MCFQLATIIFASISHFDILVFEAGHLLIKHYDSSLKLVILGHYFLAAPVSIHGLPTLGYTSESQYLGVFLWLHLLQAPQIWSYLNEAIHIHAAPKDRHIC